MNNHGYVNPIKADKYCKDKLQETLEMCVKHFEDEELKPDEFDEIVKNTRKNYTEDTEEISFELLLVCRDGDMYFTIDKYGLDINGSRYGNQVHERVLNYAANDKLYNQLLEFCK